jgi:hypothetical protein
VFQVLTVGVSVIKGSCGNVLKTHAGNMLLQMRLLEGSEESELRY